MSPPPGGDGIGEAGGVAPGQGDALDFKPGGPGVVGVLGQAEIQARPARNRDLWPYRGIALYAGQPIRSQGLGDQLVRSQGVYSHPNPTHPNHLEGMRQFALRVIAGGAADLGAGPVGARHGARIRAVNRQHLSGFGFDVGEEALVAAHQSTSNQSGDRQPQDGGGLSRTLIWLRTHFGSHHSKGFT